MKTLPPFQIGSVSDPTQVYPPREDTFFLLRHAQKELKPDDIVLEVGTGSGYIAAHLDGCLYVVATDINPHAAIMAKLNGLNVVRTDIAAGICRIFSFVLFNPPYIPTHPEEKCDDWLEYALDGGFDGRGPLRRFLLQIPEVLTPDGRILVLISSLQDFEKCEELFIKYRYSFQTIGNEILDDGEELRIYHLQK